MAMGLCKQNIKVYAFANPNSLLFKKLNSNNIETFPISISTFSLLNPIKLLKLYFSFKKINAQAIILNLPVDIKVAGSISKLARINNIIYRRGSAIPIKNKLSNRFLFKHIVTNILTNSHETANTVLKNNATLFPKSKIKVIYNGINTLQFVNKAYNPIEQKNNQQIVIGNLARLSYQKGQEDFIPLAKNLIEKNINFKIIIGGIGELESKLKKLIQTNGLSDYIELKGFIDNPKDFLSCIDIFAFPSRWEGFGFSLIEAKLMKKPIVAYETSSNPEIVRNNIDGYLAEPFNISDFNHKILQLINNPKQRQEMGENGFNDTLIRFDISTTTEDLTNYLKNL